MINPSPLLFLPEWVRRSHWLVLFAAFSLPLAAQEPEDGLPQPIMYDATVSNSFCEDAATPENPRRALFIVHNNETGNIIITGVHLVPLGKQSKNQRVKLIPPLPQKIYAGDSTFFELDNNGSKPAFKCVDSLVLTGTRGDVGQDIVYDGYFTLDLTEDQ